MNAQSRIRADTEGFGAPRGIDPHCFEVHVPPGNQGQIRFIEHFGLAAGAYGRSDAERCVLSRKTWIAIRDDVKRHFNERLKEKDLPVGAWATGVNRVERLLGHELLVLAWAVEAAELELVPVAVRNWLALRPEERWWLYAATAAATSETKHREIGWRKALRFALTENPVREALAPSRVIAPELPKAAKSRRLSQGDPAAPLFPGFKEDAAPFLLEAMNPRGGREGTNAETVFAAERAVADRAGDPGAENLGGSAKRAKGRSKPNADRARVLLEGPKAPSSRQGVRARHAVASHG